MRGPTCSMSLVCWKSSTWHATMVMIDILFTQRQHILIDIKAFKRSDMTISSWVLAHRTHMGVVLDSSSYDPVCSTHPLNLGNTLLGFCHVLDHLVAGDLGADHVLLHLGVLRDVVLCTTRFTDTSSSILLIISRLYSQLMSRHPTNTSSFRFLMS